MKFDIGDRVKVVKEWKERKYKTLYSPSEVPVGSKGIISRVDYRQGDMVVKIGTRGYYLIDSELAHDEEANNSDLDINNNLLMGLLEAEEPTDKNINQRAFQPKFNAREEFAVWVREQFPELKEHAHSETEYQALLERKQEVMQAAEKAYSHAQMNSHACALVLIYERFGPLRTAGGKTFSFNLENFVSAIEKVSANLPTNENRHYGTKLRDGF